MGADRANFDERRQSFKFDEDNDGSGYRDGSSGMEDNAERAVIGVGINGVDMGHLDECEQREKRKTY